MSINTLREHIRVPLIGITSALAMAISMGAAAAVSEQEVSKLGDTLTLFGAEKAANADGSIPEYTGGLPRDFAPEGFVPDSGQYPNPFADEKPLFTVDASNLAEHEEYLTVGAKALMQRFPDFRMEVYQTHRTIGYPEHVLRHCKNNAANATLTESGLGVQGAYACVPFPIPQSGLEVVWNNFLRYAEGLRTHVLQSATLVDSSGHRTSLGDIHYHPVNLYADPNKDKLEGHTSRMFHSTTIGPPAQNGYILLQHYSIDYDEQDSQTWSYTPGQRRVRLAPEFAYDTPVSSYGGAIFYDEINGYAGRPDRFDWEIVGKKEIYVPYNNYDLLVASREDSLDDNFVKPEVMRWEKHRVWVVEGTVKQGERHTYAKRTFYINEDTWAVTATESYDNAGEIYRIGFFPTVSTWDYQTYYAMVNWYDFTKNNYLMGNVVNLPGAKLEVFDDLGNPTKYRSTALSGRGIR